MESFSNMMVVFPKTMEDFAIPSLLSHKLNGLNVCRNGAFRTESETITRKPNTSEIEFENQNKYCQFQERESLKYKLTNMIEKIDVTTKRVQGQGIIRQKKETKETKIFVIERRTNSLPLRLVLALWKQLKRLSSVTTNESERHIENHPVLPIKDKKMHEISDVSDISAKENALLAESIARNLPFSKGDCKSAAASPKKLTAPPEKPALDGQNATNGYDDTPITTKTTNFTKKFFKMLSSKKKSSTLPVPVKTE